MMRKMRILGVLVLAGACSAAGKPAGGDSGGAMAAAPAMATPDPAAVRQSIDAANRAAMDGANKGDFASMLANYEAQALLMMPGAPAWKGSADIEKNLKAMVAETDVKDMVGITDDVVVSGDYAIETGHGSWKMGPKGKKLTEDKFKYVTVWHKQADGSWKIVRDINNSDLPPKM